MRALPLVRWFTANGRAAATAATAARAQSSLRPQEKLSELLAKNAQNFDPRQLPQILVSASKRPADTLDEGNLRTYLERARAVLQHMGAPAKLLGAGSAVGAACAARRLQLPQGNSLALSLLSLLAAEAQEANPAALVEIGQAMMQNRLADSAIWAALADAAGKATDMAPAELVLLLDVFRRALTLGFRNDEVFGHLSRRAADCAEEFNSAQLVNAFGSLSRLGNHIAKAEQHRTLQLLLDHWLAAQGPLLESTAPVQVVKLAVSLTNVQDFLGSKRVLKSEAFVDAASSWALRVAAPVGGTLGAEDLVVLLWALKELTALGLGPHRALAASALSRVSAEGVLEKWTLLRLVQASEVLLASRHALPSIDADLAGRVLSQLATAVAGDCRPDMLGRVVALWEQVGESVWEQAPKLAEAIVAKTLSFTQDASVGSVQLGALLGTVVSASLMRNEGVRAKLRSALAARPDAAEPILAAVGRRLAETSTPTAADKDEPVLRERAPPSPMMHPLALVERLALLCKQNAPDKELLTTSEALLGMLGAMPPVEVVPLLEKLLPAVRRRLVRTPALLELVERLGDIVAEHAGELLTLHLTTALNCFANVGLPYYLLYEAVLLAIVERHSLQGVSWSQAMGVLEAFAAVRLRIPELSVLFRCLRRPPELARLPTMALVRLLLVSARLELLDGSDVLEIMDRVLAETTPQRPLPQESSAMLVQSLLLSGTALPDRQLRHLLSWISGSRVQHLTVQQLTALRQYSLFLLAQPDSYTRGCLLRLPVEMQHFVSGLLQHRANTLEAATSDATRRFRGEVAEFLEVKEMGLNLGPAGSLDLRRARRCWLLDGPEAFFRPFTVEMRRTPQEQRRAWLLGRLLSDRDVRKSVGDFFPRAADWPELGEPTRVSWLEWARAPLAQRSSLLGLEA